MGEDRLLTVVQVSDLHFGDDPQGSSQPSPALLALSGLFKGWLDHHFQAVSDLHEAWNDLLEERQEGLLFVLSGDLTANGAVQQFDLVADFLGSKTSANAFGMSLDLANWADLAILGDHDQWPGTNRVVGVPALCPNPNMPRRFPVISNLIPLSGGVKLRVVLVDSDADVGPRSYDRAFGRGRFQSQSNEVRQRLPKPERGEVRVMVVHHAIADDDVPPSAGPVPFPGWSVAAQ